MFIRKITFSFFITANLTLIATIQPGLAHVLSDNPPNFWQTVDEDFYDSINNAACDRGGFDDLQKNITTHRDKINRGGKRINQLKASISRKEKQISKIILDIEELETKLEELDANERKQRDKLLAQITKKRREYRKAHRRITRLQTGITTSQMQIDELRLILTQDEINYANLNSACGSVAGVWKSDGYGYVVDILEGRIRSYNVTSEICVRDKSFANDESFFDDYDFYEFAQDAHSIRVAKQDDIPFELKFQRIDGLPSQCLQTVRRSQIAIFEAFASFFDQHYPFFDLYGVDWSLETKKARAMVTADTSDEELFNILTGMLTNVKDGHIFLEAKIGGDYFEFDANPFEIDIAIENYAERLGIDIDDADDLFFENFLVKDIETHILGGNAIVDNEEIVYYGMTSDDIGYIAITAEEIVGDDPLEDIALIDEIMEEALTLFNENNAKSVIIDLSINYGGFDSIARTITERFAAQRTLGYSKRAGDDPNAQNVDIFIEPADGERFTGPVYLITSNATISAGEILTLGLRALPNVTHVGAATNGALSDQLEKKLANHWNLSLSREIYTDSQGNNWESLGIPPEIHIPVFDLDDPIGSAHRDAVDILILLIDAQHP